MSRILLWLISLASLLPAIPVVAADAVTTISKRDPSAWKNEVVADVFSMASLNSDLFYVSLPFNDLTDPDVAAKWLLAAWISQDIHWKAVSACDGRWIEIKSAEGTVCYAQWKESVPMQENDPDYVFGYAGPKDPSGVGLAISPPVAQYLKLDSKMHWLSWRFVEDKDVRPGLWLKAQEQALINGTPPKGAGSDDPRVMYLKAYNDMAQACQLEKSGDLKNARALFIQTLSEMQEIKAIDPRWESVVLSKRIDDLQAKIAFTK